MGEVDRHPRPQYGRCVEPPDVGHQVFCSVKGDLVLKVEECWARKQGQLELHCFYYNKKKGKVETKNKVIQDEKERMRIQRAAQN